MYFIVSASAMDLVTLRKSGCGSYDPAGSESWGHVEVRKLPACPDGSSVLLQTKYLVEAHNKCVVTSHFKHAAAHFPHAFQIEVNFMFFFNVSHIKVDQKLRRFFGRGHY